MKIINLLLILFPLSVIGQDYINKEYKIFNLSEQTSIFDSSIKIYCKKQDHLLYRKSDLDSLAGLMTSYFLKCLQFSSGGVNLEDIFDYIPSNSSAHSRFFGNPTYFKEPKSLDYPDPLVNLPKLGIFVKAEIMQQEYWGTSSETKLSDIEIVQRAIKSIEKRLGRNYILNEYKGSEEHNSIITKYGIGLYGTSTKIIISKKFDKKSRTWEYEAVVINCTNFSKKLIAKT